MTRRILCILLALLVAVGSPAPAQEAEVVDFLKQFLALVQKKDGQGVADLIKAKPDLAEKTFDAVLAEYRTTAEGETKQNLLLCAQMLAVGLKAAGRPRAEEALKAPPPTAAATPQTQASPASSTVSDDEAVELLITLAFEFGNFTAAWRMCDQIKQLLTKKATAAEAAESLEQLNVLECYTDAFSGQYARAISRAEALIPKSNDELAESFHLCALIAGRRSEQPQVVDRHLAPALKLLAKDKDEAQPLGLFMVESMAFERELQKNPSLPLEQFFSKHDAIWKNVNRYPKPVQKSFSHGRVLWEGARFWLSELADRARTATDSATKEKYKAAYEKDLAVCSKLAMAYDEVPGLWKNPEFPFGLFDVVLDLVQVGLNAEKYAEAEKMLGTMEKDFMPAMAEFETQSAAVEQQMGAYLEPLRKTTPDFDVIAFKFSLVEGDIARIKARFYQLKARLALAKAGREKMEAAQLQQAQADVEKARQAQTLAARGQGSQGLEDPDWDLLRILFTQRPAGWENAAAGLLNPMLASNQQLGYRPGQILGLTYQGELKLAQGDKAGAVASLKQATELAQKHIVESGGASASKLRERYKRAFDLLTQLQIEAGGAQDAYDTLGRMQQVNAVASASGVENKELQQVTTLRGQIDSLESQIAKGRSTGQSTKATEELLARTKGEFFTALNDIRRQNPKYEAMLAIRPVNFSKQQSSIPEDAALVQYFPADDTLYIFVVTRKDFRIHKVQVKSEELTRLVMAFRNAAITQTTKALSTRGAAPAPGSAEFTNLEDSIQRLYAYLYEPVEKDVADKKVIAFIPTGILTYVPYPALARKVGDKLEYLAERKQSVTLLKSSDLEQLDNAPAKKQGGVVAVGNPDGSLPAATAEVQEIAKIFGSKALVGAAATSDRVAKAPKETAYLHLATHGVLDSRDPNASYLLMAGGRLAIQDIYGLTLPKVRVVTLSACQTALGERNPGSEFQSLADAFSIAGSNSVVASLWSVSDASTSELMVEFYKNLKAGSSLAAALQGAELKLIKGGKYSHPFFWAPFVLIGDWR